MQSQNQKRGPGRPPTSSRAVVEKIALALMLRDGYENVSVESIVAAAGIGRTTLFRYFGSKGGVIWTAFDETIASLQELLATAGLVEPSPAASALDTARHAIVESARVAFDSSDMWLPRFELIDSSPALRGGTYDHWERWKSVVANYLASHSEHSSTSPEIMSVAAALQTVFVSVLRDAALRDIGSKDLLLRLDDSLLRLSPPLALIVG